MTLSGVQANDWHCYRVVVHCLQFLRNFLSLFFSERCVNFTEVRNFNGKTEHQGDFHRNERIPDGCFCNHSRNEGSLSIFAVENINKRQFLQPSDTSP